MPTRRFLLQAAAGTALAAPPLRPSLAAADTEKRLMIVVLRGALALARPGEADGLLDLDGLFGLHPALAPLHLLSARGELALAPAVATAHRGRSHFDAQNILENCSDTAYALPDGWPNRALAPLCNSDRRLGLGVGTTVPLMIRGDTRISTCAPKVLPDIDDAFLAKLRQMYAGDDTLHGVLEEAIESGGMVEAAVGGAAEGRRRPARPRRRPAPA